MVVKGGRCRRQTDVDESAAHAFGFGLCVDVKRARVCDICTNRYKMRDIKKKNRVLRPEKLPKYETLGVFFKGWCIV